MPRKPKSNSPKRCSHSIHDLVDVMARLRSPTGCPWDREQDHMTLRTHAIEEVYELLDAIESGDDHELTEELGDLLLQVVFHCQLGAERGAFDFDKVARIITDKLVRRHPHVFGDAKADTVDAVWTQWEQIKKAEKKGTKHERPSALDGIPRHLPALLRAEKLVKKARKAELLPAGERPRKRDFGAELFEIVAQMQASGKSAEAALRAEIKKRERALRKAERRSSG